VSAEREPEGKCWKEYARVSVGGGIVHERARTMLPATQQRHGMTNAEVSKLSFTKKERAKEFGASSSAKSNRRRGVAPVSFESHKFLNKMLLYDHIINKVLRVSLN